jgi:hypothetical protein
MTITIEQTIYEPVPTGKYPAKIAEITEEEGQFGPQLKFQFELPPDEEGNERSLVGWTSRKFSKKSKLYKWTAAVLGGVQIAREYNFNSDDLMGRKVYLHVVEKTGDNGPFNKIEDLEPYQPQPVTQPQGDW